VVDKSSRQRGFTGGIRGRSPPTENYIIP